MSLNGNKPDFKQCRECKRITQKVYKVQLEPKRVYEQFVGGGKIYTMCQDCIDKHNREAEE